MITRITTCYAYRVEAGPYLCTRITTCFAYAQAGYFTFSYYGEDGMDASADPKHALAVSSMMQVPAATPSRPHPARCQQQPSTVHDTSAALTLRAAPSSAMCKTLVLVPVLT